jgi:trk system potassium uptake protein TrkH
MLTGFILAILVGTFLLLLPQSTVSGSITLIDALFTATSAVCVTGLVVLDTASDFSLMGQLVILLMIQLGGIGIVFFSVLFAFVFMGRVSIGQKSMFSSQMTPKAHWDIWGVFRTIFIFTVVVEIIGALFMYFPIKRVITGDTGTALYFALFHSISGFCNAGFSLMSDSFMSLRTEPLATVPLMILIILGGIGFFVIDDLLQYVRMGGKHSISLHSKMVLVTSVVLIIAGAAIVFVFEYFNSFSGEGLIQRVFDSLFMSITARTAGFNTISITGLANPSLFIVVMLMFIGASPGSTGGGVKTSTTAVVWSLILARYRGRENPAAFRRSIPTETISHAQAILATSMAVVIIITLLILVTEIGEGTGMMMERDYFVSTLFEVVSAFGTVGLSMGITPSLNVVNKFLIIVTMFIGRLGPLTFLLALKRRGIRARFTYAEENVLVG